MNFNKIGISEIDGERMGFRTLEVEHRRGHFMGITGELFDIFQTSNSVRKGYPLIKKVIYNDPATIVIWSDDTKTVVKCQPGDVYDKEKGLAMCISKKFLGNKGNFNEEFKKWIPEEETINEDISVEEMRVRLDEFCDGVSCNRCVLTGEVCRCGRGSHFKIKRANGTYDMTDDEIRDAYNRAFK